MHLSKYLHRQVKKVEKISVGLHLATPNIIDYASLNYLQVKSTKQTHIFLLSDLVCFVALCT